MLFNKMKNKFSAVQPTVRSRKNNLMTWLTVVLTAPLILNYMNISSSGYKWTGDIANVIVKINPDFSGMDGITDGASLLLDVKSSMKDWFLYGKAKIVLVEETSDLISPRGMEVMICGLPLGTATTEANIFATRLPDPDRTGKSCVFQWSCTNENIQKHSDIQFNAFNYKWTSLSDAEGDELNMKGESLHAIGHLLGLDHCLPGETDLECRAGYTDASARQSCLNVGGLYSTEICNADTATAKCQFIRTNQEVDIIFYKSTWQINDASVKCGLIKGKLY